MLGLSNAKLRSVQHGAEKGLIDNIGIVFENSLTNRGRER